MKRILLSSLITALVTVAALGTMAWATGVTDSMDILPEEVEGTMYVEGQASLDGTDLVLPFSMQLELVQGEPQLRSLKVGENGVSVEIPRVIRKQVSDALADYGKLIGDVAHFGLDGLRMGVYVDALNIDFVVSVNVPIKNPYGYREETTPLDRYQYQAVP